MRQLLQILNERLNQRRLFQIVCYLIYWQRIDLDFQRAVYSARHDRADRLGRAPLAMVAGCQRCVWPRSDLDGSGKFFLKRIDAV